MKGVWLLDVNVLIGWLWPAHQTHRAATAWMKGIQKEHWATCPMTELGFLRIVTSRSFSPMAPKWGEAVSILRGHTENNPQHHFWPDSFGFGQLDRQFGKQIQGPNQVTDAYLLALAMSNGGSLVTFDYRMASLVKPGSLEDKALSILRP